MKRRPGRESDPHGCDPSYPRGALGAWVGMKQGTARDNSGEGATAKLTDSLFAKLLEEDAR